MKRLLLAPPGSRYHPIERDFPFVYLLEDDKQALARERVAIFGSDLARLPAGQAYQRRWFAAAQGGFGFDTAEQRDAQFGLSDVTPLLDNTLLDFCFRTPPELLEPGQAYKGLLRRAMGKRLPARVAKDATPVYHTDMLTSDLGVLALFSKGENWSMCQAGYMSAERVDLLARDCQTTGKVDGIFWRAARAETLMRSLIRH